MSFSGSPSGNIRPVHLLILAGFLLCTAGCVTGSGPSAAGAAVNDTNTSAVSEGTVAGVQGLVARPGSALDRPVTRSPAVLVTRTTSIPAYTGPSLNATGEAVTVETIVLQTETISRG